MGLVEVETGLVMVCSVPIVAEMDCGGLAGWLVLDDGLVFFEFARAPLDLE